MKIFFVSPYAPTPIRTRSLNFIRGLARRGHIVTLATVWENESERGALCELEQQGVCVLSARLSKPRVIWNIFSVLPTRAPVQSAYSWLPSLQSLIANSPFDYDLIHVEHLRGARYGLALKSWLAARQLKIPIVWDGVDCISHLFEQTIRSSRAAFAPWIARFELGRTRFYERRAVEQFDRVLVTSDADQTALERIALPAREHISVVPIGVDLDYFAPLETLRESKVIVFSGKMSYHANATTAIYLAKEIMPRVWAKQPDVQLWLVGANPSRQIRQLTARAHPNRVLVTGTVPDLRDYLARATIAVAPIVYGAGIQSKVLEAMAMGTPVVATPQATAALKVCDGENVLVAGDAESFARAIILLLHNPGLRERIGSAGRKYVEAHHDWGAMIARLEEIYKEEISKKNAQV